MIKSFFVAVDDKSNKLKNYLIIGSFAAATIPYTSTLYVSKVINQIENIELNRWLLITTAMILLQLVLKYVLLKTRAYIDKKKECAKRNLEGKIIEKSFVIDYEEIEKQERLDVLRSTHNSTESVGGIAQQIEEIFAIFTSAFSIFYSLAFVFFLFRSIKSNSQSFFESNLSTWLLFGLLLLVSISNVFILKKIQKNYNALFISLDRTNSIGEYLTDGCFYIKNGKDFRLFGLDNLINKYWDEIYVNSLKKYLQTGKKGGKLYGYIGILSQVSMGLSYVIIGAKAIYGIIKPGDVILFVSAISILFAATGNLISSISGFRYRYMLFEKYISFLKIPEEKTKEMEEVIVDFNNPTIEFKNVCYRFENQEINVLNNINLKINANSKTAIVGPNGAGKTTLIKLLCRLYKPTEGRILINGIDIENISMEEYRKVLSVVFQDYELFSYPLDENITIGEKSEKNINRILKDANIFDRVSSYKDGLMTRLNNDNGAGIDLSGGESQKIAIARAIYKDGGIFILDEPTAALDPVSEEEIFNNMVRMSDKKTTIFISHRMSSCRTCDKIIVLNKGEIVEEGNHTELMVKNGLYKELFTAQANYYLEE